MLASHAMFAACDISAPFGPAGRAARVHHVERVGAGRADRRLGGRQPLATAAA